MTQFSFGDLGTLRNTESNLPTKHVVSDEVTRVKIFIWLQMFFLVVSGLTGGFHYKLWSMLDTALLIQSIGITGLVLVLDQPRLRRTAFMSAVVLYLLGLIDMGINVLISGVVGWHAISP